MEVDLITESLWEPILNNLSKGMVGSMYKPLTCVNKNFNTILSGCVSKAAINKMTNHLLTLLKLFPNKDWNRNSLSMNPNITWEFVKTNPDKDWNWPELSGNPNITWEIVRDNPDRKWSWSFLLHSMLLTVFAKAKYILSTLIKIRF